MTVMHIFTETGVFGNNRRTVTGFTPIDMKTTELELSSVYYDAGRVRTFPQTYEVIVPPPAIEIMMDAIMLAGRQLRVLDLTVQGQKHMTEAHKSQNMPKFVSDHAPSAPT